MIEKKHFYIDLSGPANRVSSHGSKLGHGSGSGAYVGNCKANGVMFVTSWSHQLGSGEGKAVYGSCGKYGGGKG